MPSSSSHRSSFVVAVKDLKCCNVPSLGIFKRPGKCYVQLALGAEKKTTSPSKGPVVEWSEVFHFDIQERDDLKIGLYVVSKIGSDFYVGGLKESVQCDVAEEKPVHRPLVTYDAEGNPNASAALIQFTIMIFPRPGQDNPSIRSIRTLSTNRHLSIENDRRRRTSNTTTSTLLSPIDFSPMFHQRSLSGSEGYNTTYTSSPSPTTLGAVSSESEPVGAAQGYQTLPTNPCSPVRTVDVPDTIPATSGSIVPLINIRQPSLPAPISKETTDTAVSEAFDGVQQMRHAPKVLHTSNNVYVDSTNRRDSGHNSSDSSAWVSLLDKVRSFARLMDTVAEVHPYAQLAWIVLSAAYKILDVQNARDNSIDSLVGTMRDVYTTIHQSEPLSNLSTHAPILALMAKQTTECAYFIRDYAKKKRFLTRLMTHALSNTDTQIQKYRGKFADLRKALQEKAVIQTEITVLHTRVDLERLSEVVADIVTAIDLDDMNYARGARYNPDKGCLPGTREGLITQILGWINDDTDDTSQVLLLHGDPGVGKSAVANEIAKRFDALRRLGSSFCFDRSHQAERRPDNVFSTIARDLAESDHQRKARLHDAIKGKRSIRTTSSILEQFEIFILQPAVQLQSLTVGPILIVIDALDESGDAYTRRDILSALADKAQELPSNFRILITTRGEDDILTSLSHLSHVFCIDMNQLDVESDISLFVEKELDDVTSISSDSIWRPWLVDSSNGVFQWAFTACNFVKGGGDLVTDPEQKLNILASAPQGDIDSLDRLYLEVLKQTFVVQAADRMRRFKAVVGHTLAAQAPLSMTSLKELHSQYGTAADVDEILRPLGVLFSGVASDTEPVHLLHESFRDFLTNEKRSGPFYVDVSLYRRDLVIRSLMLMNSYLHFNICKLEQSFSFNQDFQDFHERAKKNIPPHVSYACRFWPEQLSVTIYDPQIAKLVATFLTSKAIFWLEVLSAKREIKHAPSMLLDVIRWSQDDSITALAKDLRQFVLAFGSMISRSIPHIYLSALPAAPQRSKIAEIYNPQYLPSRATLCDAVLTWPSIQNTVICDTGTVLCVALSRDGKHFASGSSNAVTVWDLTTGEIVSGPLTHDDASAIISIAFSHSGRYIASGSEGGIISAWHIDSGRTIVCSNGHSDSITSMMYSQQFELLVSGSSDCTIRTWDALTLESISIFHGPKEGINCVSISPNSILLASGSDDKAVQIWDIQTGAKRMPFEGHTRPVTSVAFAPDNDRIISGSNDCTVRMWNVSTGASLAVYKNLGTLASLVNSVALSPDGKLVVSGSNRPEVAVWRTQYHNTLPELLCGHRDSITSIAFAQGGSSEHFVSGSKDGTMNVWTTQGLTEGGTSAALARNSKSAWGCYHSTTDGTTFNFHCLVTSVAYSPSRKRVATGSSDGAFRVWDAISGKLLVGPIKADSYSVNSVCFSPDGKIIASGGDDSTLCLWESTTGKPASPPFKAHRKKLLSVSFSPDGAFLLSASRDHTIVVWDRSGNVIAGPLRGHSTEVNSVAFSSDGKRIVSGADDIYIWETHGGRVSGPFKGHVKQVLSVTFSHDDTRILSGGKDHTVRIWDVVTGKNSTTLRGHTKAVCSVQFVPSDMLILSGSADNTVRLWDVLQEQTISVFRTHTNSVSSVALAPDGTRFASGSDDGVMRVRDLWAGEWQAPFKGNLPTRFNGICLLDDGWIADSRGKLLLWLPPWARVGFWLTHRIIVVQGYGSLDLTQLLQDDRWHTLCRRAAETIVPS